jgi:hypothetical protein
MPTYGRPEVAFQQASNIYSQISNLQSQNKISVKYIVSINGDKSYPVIKFSKVADTIIEQGFNMGASLNIVYGFISALKFDYDFLWIIGDDEPIPKDAIHRICQLIEKDNFDFLIGSLNKHGNLNLINSYQKLSSFTGGTNSFISSTIYRCDLISKKDIDRALDFNFTNFPHLVIINRIIERVSTTKIICVPLFSICRMDLREPPIDGRTPRKAFGYGDSLVFFGKPLTLLGVDTNSYKKRELLVWWTKNWHRVSMFKDKDDFRPKLLEAISSEFFSLRLFIRLGRLPIWKLKNLLRPIKK